MAATLAVTSPGIVPSAITAYAGNEDGEVPEETKTDITNYTLKQLKKGDSEFTGGIYDGTTDFKPDQVVLQSNGKEDITIDLADENYTVNYTNSTDSTDTVNQTKRAGNVTISIECGENADYTGTVNITDAYEISQLDLANTNYKVVPSTEALTYDGTEKTPASFTVQDKDNASITLISGEDYVATASYENNVNATTDSSKAKITVTGTGNYTGTLSAEYDIEKGTPPKPECNILDSDIKDTSVTITKIQGDSYKYQYGYKGENDSDITYNETYNDNVIKNLTANTEYTFYVKIVADDNVTDDVVSEGVKKTTAAQSIESGVVTLAKDQAPYVYKGAEWKPTPTSITLTVGNEEKIIDLTDNNVKANYTISYDKNTDASEVAEVNITAGKDSGYSGTATGYFTITPLELESSNVTVKVDDKNYDGTTKATVSAVTINTNISELGDNQDGNLKLTTDELKTLDAQFEDKNASDDPISVTIENGSSTTTYNGVNAGNFSFTFPTTKAKINKNSNVTLTNKYDEFTTEDDGSISISIPYANGNQKLKAEADIEADLIYTLVSDPGDGSIVINNEDGICTFKTDHVSEEAQKVEVSLPETNNYSAKNKLTYNITVIAETPEITYTGDWTKACNKFTGLKASIEPSEDDITPVVQYATVDDYEKNKSDESIWNNEVPSTEGKYRVRVKIENAISLVNGSYVSDEILELTSAETETEEPTTTTGTTTTTTTETKTSTNSSGNTVTTTTTTVKDSTGKVASVTEQSVIANAAANTSASVTVNKDGSGTITSAAADITNTVSSGNKSSIDGAVVKQVTEAAGTSDIGVTLIVKDSDGSIKYTVKADASDLTAGNSLKVYSVDSTTGEYVMVNAKTYTVDANGSVSVSLADGNYVLVTKAEATAINKAIKATIKPAKTKATIKKGKKTTFKLSSKINKSNIKKITYSTSKKSVAKVSKSGKITAKKKGTATIKAKVTLKNGTTKTLKMKIKVK
jgi:hypothetical protein